MIIYFNPKTQRELPYIWGKARISLVLLRKPSMKNLKRFVNYFLSNISLKLLLIRSIGKPYEFGIDPSNICTLSCPLCPTGLRDRSRYKKIMRFKEFKRIIDDIEDSAINISLINWGEPMLNKELFKMIFYCKKVKQIPFVWFSTNLNIFLSASHVRQLLKSGVDMIVVSIDGISQKTYQLYRKGGELNLVLHNLNILIEEKKRLATDKPYIIWQYLPFKHNLHEIIPAMNYARKIGVDAFYIGFARANTGYYVINPIKDNLKISLDFLPEPGSKWSLYNKDYTKKKFSKLCTWLWLRMVINPDGSVSPCCNYYPQKYDFDNIFKHSLKDIWNSKKYIEARRIMRDKLYSKKCNYEKSIVCSICIALENYVDC